MEQNVKIKANETWVNSKWRPALGWTYICICVFDFIIAPTLNYFFFGKTGGGYIPWKSLTMSDGGLFHLSMGAVLGITSWTRGQEKINSGRSPYPRYESTNYDESETRESYRDRPISPRDPIR